MRHILLIALAVIYANYAQAQSTDTIELSDLVASKAIKPFSHQSFMYVKFKGKTRMNGYVEYSAVPVMGDLAFVKHTVLLSGEFIDSVLVDAATLETKYVALKNGRRDSVQSFDFRQKKLVMGKSFDPNFKKEIDVPDNTFCALIINELFKKISIKDKTRYVIRNYNPYSGKIDFQELTVVGTEKIDAVGDCGTEAWKMELVQGKFVHRIWVDVISGEPIKQVSIFPNGAEYWESRIL